MKIQIKNLGPLKEAEFEVADLTTICGGNNIGKTYATYALFGFLHTWREMVSIDIDNSIVFSLQNNRGGSIDIEKYIRQSQEIINSICRKYSNKISGFLATSPDALKNTKFEIIIAPDDIEHWRSCSYENVALTPRSKT